MQPGIAFLGALCLALAGGLQAGRQYLSPYIAKQIEDGIRQQVIWQPDSPPVVRGKFCNASLDLVLLYASPRRIKLKPLVCILNTPLYFTDRFVGSEADPPDYVRFYLLNITNLADVRKGGKPVLVRGRSSFPSLLIFR
jgi:hypothetical protein